ncbi:hypothetical protein Purlil1_13688 [Purpureocillium lilacinum]|uniref:Uncharacterized protein n=1 Tax=Purpureocillium lilacinum TaxID=33203 RepID=A0ABR0BDE8_PURLI|nr:hypothetical protein Purlil1_13688 [Purpureocillium lilacinum]
MTFYEFSLVQLKSHFEDLDFLEVLMEYLEAQDDWTSRQKPSVDHNNRENLSQIFIATDAPHEMCFRASWSSREVQAMWDESTERQHAIGVLSRCALTDSMDTDRIFVEQSDTQGHKCPTTAPESMFGFYLIHVETLGNQVAELQHRYCCRVFLGRDLAVLAGAETQLKGKFLFVGAESSDSLEHIAGILAELNLSHARVRRFVRFDTLMSPLEAILAAAYGNTGEGNPVTGCAKKP